MNKMGLHAALLVSVFAMNRLAPAQVSKPPAGNSPAGGATATGTATTGAAVTPAVVPDQAELDARFIKAMTGATLAGSFTEGAAGAIGSDRYNIVSVKRTDGDNWEIVTRIRFKSFDVNVPLVMPVKWAGDTAVITVDDLKVPGIGTYTARVMIFGDQYAGIWRGANHGGHMWGKIEHEAAEPSSSRATQPAK